MFDISRISPALRRNRSSLRLAALGALAGLAYGMAVPAPASAAPSDWRGGCQDKAAPQGYGEMIRYNNCVRQRDCQQLANAAGTTVFAAGCFWVSPEAPVASDFRRPAR